MPHWGNGNVYHEDSAGAPFYDFTILDQAYDAIVGAGITCSSSWDSRRVPWRRQAAAGTFTDDREPTLNSAYESGLWAFRRKDYSKVG